MGEISASCVRPGPLGPWATPPRQGHDAAGHPVTARTGRRCCGARDWAARALPLGQVPPDDHDQAEDEQDEYAAGEDLVPSVDDATQRATDRPEGTRHETGDPVADRIDQS